MGTPAALHPTVLRITKIRETTRGSELLVEGRLTEASAPDLVAVCEADLTAGRRVLLDLSGLPTSMA